MTKFEEEFKALTSWDWINIDLIQQILTRFGNWHSDEEFQDLKSQLQQQALPVVPEFVGEFITKVKKAGNNLTFAFNSKFDECPAKYWNEAIVWRLNHPEEFAIAFITGNYQVEKPQLFYLKNKLTNSYLCQYPSDKSFYHLVVDDDGVSKLVTKFTQQEIDSMQTGSYEQIEVAE